MKLNRIKALFVSTLLGVATINPVFGGGAIDFQWNNIGAFDAAPTSLLYSDSTGLSLLSPGVQEIANDGFLLQLVAFQGGSNYVLVADQVGDNPAAISGVESGKFNFLSTVLSNVIAGAVGSPLGLVFYNNTSIGNATAYGTITNLTITVPTPNYVVAPFDPTVLEIDWSSPSFSGPRTANGGFWTDTALVVVPEPSTVFLVGMGLAGAWVLRRRK